MAEDFPSLSPEDISRSRRREEVPEMRPEDVQRRTELPPIRVGRPTPGPASFPDIAKAALAQGTLGVTADVPGLPGDIAAFGARALPEPYAGYAKGIGAALPTSKAIEEWEKSKIPGLGYKGESPQAREIGAATRTGASMAVGPGGLPAAAGRFAIGYGASTAGQEFGRGLEDADFISPEYKGYAEPAITTAATLAGMKYGPTAGKMIAPKYFAEKEASEALAKDIKSGVFDIDAYREAQRAGVDVSPADFAREGSVLRGLIESQGGMTPTTKAAIDEYRGSILAQPGTRVKGRFQEAYDQTKNLLEKVNSNQPIQVAELEDYLKDSGKHIRDDVYNLARTSPQAGNIDFTSLGTYKTADGLSQPLVKHPLLLESIYDVTKNANTYDPKYGIIPPRPVTLANGQQMTNPGNIAFWDMVKRDLDQKARNAFARGESQDVVRGQGYQFARNELVDRLDRMVPGYEIARNKAAETFGTESAPAAGMMFYNKMDKFDTRDARNAFASMTPEQRNLFKTGWLANLQTDLQKGGPGFTKVAESLTLPGDFQTNARMVLGRDFDAVRGSVIGNSAKMLARPIAAGAPPAFGESFLGNLKTSGLVGGGIAGLVSLATEAAFQASMLPDIGTKVAAGAATAAGLSKLKATAEHVAANRIANKLVPMLLSEDPKVMANLSKLVDRDPRIARTVSNLNMRIQAMQQPRVEPVVEQYEKSQTQPREMPIPMPDFGRRERASGGRIPGSMTAEKLLAALKSAHKSVQNETKSLLDEPDEVIAKALTVANKHI